MLNKDHNLLLSVWKQSNQCQANYGLFGALFEVAKRVQLFSFHINQVNFAKYMLFNIGYKLTTKNYKLI